MLFNLFQILGMYAGNGDHCDSLYAHYEFAGVLDTLDVSFEPLVNPFGNPDPVSYAVLPCIAAQIFRTGAGKFSSLSENLHLPVADWGRRIFSGLRVVKKVIVMPVLEFSEEFFRATDEHQGGNYRFLNVLQTAVVVLFHHSHRDIGVVSCFLERFPKRFYSVVEDLECIPECLPVSAHSLVSA